MSSNGDRGDARSIKNLRLSGMSLSWSFLLKLERSCLRYLEVSSSCLHSYWAACAPSHKRGFRSSAAKNGLPGEGRHEGLVPRNDVLTNGFI